MFFCREPALEVPMFDEPAPDEESAQPETENSSGGGKTDEEESQTLAVKEPAKKPPKRKEIDLGKLMALRKAGWSMKNIGIELGCSEGTIFNYLKKMEEGRNE
jgi:DNA-binding NarL/FixJ family response regulator